MDLLTDFNMEHISHSFLRQLVGQFISDGTWNLPAFLPTFISTTIHSIQISTVNEICLWKGSDMPIFRKFLMQFFDETPKVDWHNFIWHKNLAIKYSAFAWPTFKRGLKTTDLLSRRGIPVGSRCILCYTASESHSHLFF